MARTLRRRVEVGLMVTAAVVTTVVAGWTWHALSTQSAAVPATSSPAPRPSSTARSTALPSSTTPIEALTVSPVNLDPAPLGPTALKLAGALGAFVRSLPTTACLVVDEGNTRVLARRSTTLLAPASTQKLFTAAAALNVLGPDHRFTTRVVTKTELRGDTISGDLYLVGDGDPVLSTADYQAGQRHQPALATSIELLADRIVAAGVRHIGGSIIGDEHKFANDRYLSSWGYPYDYTTRTGPLSALVMNDGWVSSSEVQTDPAEFAARTLQLLLERRGVTVAGRAVPGQSPANTVALAGVDSPRLGDIVNEMLRNSDNMTAEILAKDVDIARHGIGRIDTAANSIRTTLIEDGFNLTDVEMRDASGTDKGNRASCADLAYMLHSIGNTSEVGTHGLPTAGETGTLSARYNNTAAAGRVHAKTGSITGVAGIAGFVDPPSGSSEPELTFAFLVNNVDGNDRFTLEDQLVDVLARWNLG